MNLRIEGSLANPCQPESANGWPMNLRIEGSLANPCQPESANGWPMNLRIEGSLANPCQPESANGWPMNLRIEGSLANPCQPESANGWPMNLRIEGSRANPRQRAACEAPALNRKGVLGHPGWPDSANGELIISGSCARTRGAPRSPLRRHFSPSCGKLGRCCERMQSRRVFVHGRPPFHR